MGHGGTLDPLATGVLIIGVGNGTRQLQNFLTCTKTYDTVVLFGKSTDTYDVAGKVVASAPYEHVTRELVEENLSKFRGKISQVPPIYSAIKIQGMKAYDYARSGKELPREIAAREMEVTECKMVDWYEGRKHEYRWPAEEASAEQKEVANKFMEAGTGSTPTEQSSAGQKRKASPVDEPGVDVSPDVKRFKPEDAAPEIERNESTLAGEPEAASLHTHVPPPSSTLPSPAPAAAISLTVSSGFYVRSFAHDLGLGCNSLGIMASLVRSRQGTFTLDADSALTYADLEAGEESWGPKVSGMLERWTADNPPEAEKERSDDRDRPSRGRGGWQSKQREKGFSAKRGFGSGSGFSSGSGGGGYKSWNDGGNDRPDRRRERRNTSSGED